MQWEFAGRLGPPPGRYVVRRYAGDEVHEVLVVSEADAPRRRARRAPEGTVTVTRVAVVDAGPLGDVDAPDWLKHADATLARFLSAHRVSSADPSAPDPGRALVVRVGTGTGEEVADGSWTDARALPPVEAPRKRRRSKHRPAERLAALLAARDVSLACEELTLRARGDLDCGRGPEAALQLEAALGAALAELTGWIELGDVAARLEELRDYADRVAAAALAAREGRLEPADVEVVSAALSRLEAALRARALYAAE